VFPNAFNVNRNVIQPPLSETVFCTPAKEVYKSEDSLIQLSETQKPTCKLSFTTRVPFESNKAEITSVSSHIGFDDEYTPAADNYPYVSCMSFVVIDADKNKAIQAKNDG